LQATTQTFRAMGSPCALHLYDEDGIRAEDAAEAAIAEVARLEQKYSRYRDDSIVARINASAGSKAGCRVDAETESLLDYADTAFEQSDGLFDITSGVLREVWDFRSGRLPARGAVESVLERVGWRRVKRSARRIRLAAGMQIDFGGYGKEYAADRAAQLCRDRGVHAGLVDLGGDVRVIGPHPDGSPWVVGIQDPRPGHAALATIPVAAGAVATSGDYQRYMVVEGRRYAHILDPRSGWPVRGLSSVSVVANHCLLAGTASTIAMLKGQEGASWLDALGLPNLRVDAEGRVSGTLSGAAVPKGAPKEASDTDPDQGTAVGDPSSRRPGLFASASSPGSTTT
jgi:thiamine biosynthesis lipoprotein